MNATPAASRAGSTTSRYRLRCDQSEPCRFCCSVELLVARAARATRDVEELAAGELDDVLLAGRRMALPDATRVEDPGEQRPSPAHVGLLADEAAALLQPGLQHARLVGSTSAGRRALMHEDQLALGVDVLLAQREQLLRVARR